MPDPVVVIGAGISGLVCANRLQNQGTDVLVLEASKSVGGRVQTDEVDGFLLDRGFQVLLTAYPEAAAALDYSRLKLANFEPGSLVRIADKFHRVCDPWRRPQHAISTAFAPIGSLMDKIRIGFLRRSAGQGSVDSLFNRDDRSTEDELQRLGFSQSMIETFFRPFLGGVFLDPKLETSCRMLYFVFRMFSQADTAIPARGMGRISNQLAEELNVRLNSPVSRIHQNHVELETGESIPFQNLVVATEHTAAGRLLPELKPQREQRRVRCVYFSAQQAPLTDRMLVLNGTGSGIVNNFCVPSQISPDYAPNGQSLVSATVLESSTPSEQLPKAVKTQMRTWFGKQVDDWKHLKTYNIVEALPNQRTPAFEPAVCPPQMRDGVYVCGDYRANGSINGAMQSGRLVAEAILKGQ